MIDAMTAEALKLRGHRATWLMVLIYPIVFLLFVLVQLVTDMTGTAGGAQAPTAALWIEQSHLVWGAPLSSGGRFLIAGFAAVVFAGEYGWNTWKLVIPARARWQLLAAKWIATIILLLAAFAAADLLGLLGSVLRPLAGGPAIPAGVSLSDVAQAHAAAAAHAVLPILYTVVLAGLLAVLTSSILATAGLSVATILLEQLFPSIAFFAYGYAPALTPALAQLLPFYHVTNLVAWAGGSGATIPLGANATIAAPQIVSLAALLGWTAACGALTIYRFGRQDLN
ncbi:ABC transporter permease subunit [Sphingopyxis sp. MSC1_008]|jgi:ABC-2 type transport system permease protein|uniref:ABC transporter permease subunit n=1 Tax=Sphingopyxis sp. MSC1_008 TaxID=2909265 RepID=UPI0020BE63B7|nr:ABC transporter permease subunit [Sphingopyxis sp. MSC1_008]